MKEKKKNEGGRYEERTSTVVANTDRYFRVSLCNGCCAGLHNVNNSKH
jgi:hypothetical protein